MDVSNKTYHIKDDPYFASGERIVGDFVSANHQFHEISIDTYEGDLEIWYIDRNDPTGSVLAYANGTWEIEYRYITFNNNIQLSDDDYRTLTWAYDEYIEPKRLRITYQGTTKLAKLNGKSRGSIATPQGVFPFDNRNAWSTPTITLTGDTLSTPIVDGVTKYKVYSNGSYIGYIDSDNTWHNENAIAWFETNATQVIPDITLDLSTLNLPEGTHSIQMKLSDNGLTKRDSVLSNAVEYVVSHYDYTVAGGIVRINNAPHNVISGIVRIV